MNKEIMVQQLETCGTTSPSIAPSAGPRPIRYGLPCANCKLYYSADLTACPICHCKERVSPTPLWTRSVASKFVKIMASATNSTMTT
jgi:hypothetical protein